ncbi:MAG: PEP-CTERM sorting domain-containing protein [Gallionellaceae bacterium]|nr:PEP-CTERM sorting domain-containing protein [Gallionellaceae bacterium]
MKIKFALAGVALGVAMAAGNAQAGYETNLNLPVNGSVAHTNLDLVIGATPNTDYLNFTLADLSQVSGSFDIVAEGNMTSFDVDLQKYVSGSWSDVAQLGTITVTRTGTLIHHDVLSADSFGFSTNQGAGAYRFEIVSSFSPLTPLLPFVLGTVTYHYTAAAAPVPEPGEWALILGGLGLVGSLARRRAKQKI